MHFTFNIDTDSDAEVKSMTSLLKLYYMRKCDIYGCTDLDIVIVCIGSMNVMGDSVAPRLGKRLTDLNLNIGTNLTVYGTESSPMHGANFNEFYYRIVNKHKNSLILAIDASVSHDIKLVNKVVIKGNPLEAGLGVSKKLTPIGDVSILCAMLHVAEDVSSTEIVDRIRGISYNNVIQYVNFLTSVFTNFKVPKLDENFSLVY